MKRFVAIAVLLPLLLFGALLAYLSANQQEIIQDQIASLNKQYHGHIALGAAHLKPFEYFPYMSIKVDSVQVNESKAEDASVIVDVADIYVGFNIWDLVKGKYDIEMLVVEDGVFNLVLHEDGSNNLQNALAFEEGSESEEPTNIHLKNIELHDLEINKFDEATNTKVEISMASGEGGFSTSDGLIAGHIDTEFVLNIMKDGMKTYVHHKHFELHTDATFDEHSGMLKFKPSGIRMEHGDFDIVGSLDTKDDMNFDLEIKGTKPNFDMLIAFAPEDLIPTLERYNNAGSIYFNAVIQGPTLHGQQPFIEAFFGGQEAFLENLDEAKRVEDIGFKGHFSNGDLCDFSTMEFSLTDMWAKLDRGMFSGDIIVSNFEEPEVDMTLKTDFNLDFLARFLNLKDVVTASGNVTLEMKFHDIIDIYDPGHTLSELNQAYFAELKVEDLSVNSEDLPAPLHKLDAYLSMNGKEAKLQYLDVKMGDTDLSASGFLSDLPAVVHHTDAPVLAHLEIESNLCNLAELTNYSAADSTGLDEEIKDLSLGLSFKSSAKAFTESKYLPAGEFFIDSLHAELKHYPHELRDFHADIFIDESDLNIVDFTGFIDDSDFHFYGGVHDYGFWMQDALNGDVNLDLQLTSDLLRLEDVFSYGGKNYVPEDYRHEEFEKLDLQIKSSMHYKESNLESIDVDLKRLDTKMHVHPLRFEDFKGRFHYEDDFLTIENMHGKIGRTAFDVDLNYYLGEDASLSNNTNYLGLRANYIDFDELSNFELSPTEEIKTEQTKAKSTADVASHAEAFNLYELPFSDMRFDIGVGHFIYHRLDFQNINAKLRSTQDHYLYVDTLQMEAAGGSLKMNGYFNGSDPEHIYMKPDLLIENMDIDKLLFKFENFGQDYVVSENLHGQLTTRINGLVRVYPDFVPDIDQSEVHMDLEVLNGRLQNYEPMLLLSDYTGSKDLTNIRFDTLKNHIDVTNGVLTIPAMTIESTLGHMEISGTQSMDDSLEYFFRIPWKAVSQATRSKLFGKAKKEEQDEIDEPEEQQEEEIIEVDANEKVRYLNLRLTGTTEDFKIALKKKKD